MVFIGHNFGKDEYICVVMSRAWSLEDVYWDLQAKSHDSSKFIYGFNIHGRKYIFVYHLKL